MNPSKIPTFFKTRSAKPFEFRPRYYDEAKETREKRNKMIEREMNNSSDHDSEVFRMRMQNRWSNSKTTSASSPASTIRMVVIAIVLFAVAYYLLF